MADPTTSCPNCGDYLLEETAQCLKCGYDVRAGEVRPIERNVLPSEGDTVEVSCRECGAAVREHLVRCWKCGAFMREDIADTYEKMRERAPVVEFRPLPDWNPDNEVEDTPEQKAAEKASRVTNAREAQSEPDPRETAPQTANEPEAETYALSGAVDDDDDEFEMGVEFDLDVDEGGDDFDFDGALDDELETVGDLGDIAEPTGASSEPEAPPVRRGDTSAPPVRRGATDEPPVRRTEPAAEPPADQAEQVAADSLLEIAIQEEKEVARRQRKNEKVRRKRASARRQRRKAGPTNAKKAKRNAGPAAGRYRFWIKDVSLHVVPDPAKVKVKAGALAKPTQTVDLGFGEVGLLVTSYVPQKSTLFGKAPDAGEMRKAVVEHLRKDGGLDDLPAEGHWSIEPEVARELPFEQPNEYAHETTFGGVPVFGDGRVALRLPDSAETTEKRFLVFTLTEFRRFAKAAVAYGAREFGAERGIPLVDATEKLSCHYTDQEFESLVDSTFHVHDPAIELQVVGRRCQSCELVVCEDGRKKESIGGKSGKTIGKAKCPKCSEKFGEITLYAVKAGRVKRPKPVPS